MFKSKLFVNYIVSYLMVFFVPFVIMSSIIYLHSVNNLKSEIEQSNLAKLEQVATITNERMSELESLSTRIAHDPRLTPYMINHPYYGLEAVAELKKYKANSSLVDEILIFYHHSNTIYSSEGSFSIQAFLNKYPFYDVNLDDFGEMLHTTIPNNVLFEKLNSNGEKVNYVAYFSPITLDSNSTYGSVFYLINERRLNELIENVMGDFKGNSYIVSRNNNILASTIKDQSVNIHDVSIDKSEYRRINQIELNNNNYSLAAVESPVSEWKFVTIMETAQFFERLSDTRLLIFLLCVSVFLIGGLLAIFLARKQYNPIRSLFNSVSHNRKIGATVNELETIKQTVTSVFEDHEKLSETVYKHQSFVRDQFITKILKGDFRTEEEITSYNSTLHLDIEGDYYASLIISLESGRSSSKKLIEKETIYEMVNSTELADVKAFGVDLLYVNGIALIIKMNGDFETASVKRRNFVEKLRAESKEKLSIRPIISTGSIVHDITVVNRSYIEALAALEYKYYYAQGSCIYFEEIEKEPTASLGYPKDELLKIVQSIKHGDAQVAKESLISIVDTIKHQEISHSFLRAISFDIINTVIKTISEVGIKPSQNQLEVIFDFQSIEELHSELDKLIVQTCDEVNSNKKSHNDQLKNDLIAYLDKHYHLYDLSLEKIALEFHLSASYVSRFIKEQTGSNFKQYVQNLRIEKVKQDLIHTDVPIKSIVIDVGYKDVANFTRKFKNIVGMTPGKYRQYYKEGETEEI
ncbi:helix-turn-helix domain-containing protein [Gracilibacillus suaedae]|uniref:helix-turn-helix domain-containing protein n=1 Tax=Gracilibacillus suaedae TaxID=2820273 RepID=UPI001ABDD9DA|nr:helix-turn-helix domain-containing protein [Gracilibacillus suaedae]